MNYQYEYRCDICATRFNDADIVLGTRPFESLSPCCHSEDFDLTPQARQRYRDMLKPIAVVAMPVKVSA